MDGPVTQEERYDPDQTGRVWIRLTPEGRGRQVEIVVDTTVVETLDVYAAVTPVEDRDLVQFRLRGRGDSNFNYPVKAEWSGKLSDD